jgi:hypothetical protein
MPALRALDQAQPLQLLTLGCSQGAGCCSDEESGVRATLNLDTLLATLSNTSGATVPPGCMNGCGGYGHGAGLCPERLGWITRS